MGIYFLLFLVWVQFFVDYWGQFKYWREVLSVRGRLFQLYVRGLFFFLIERVIFKFVRFKFWLEFEVCGFKQILVFCSYFVDGQVLLVSIEFGSGVRRQRGWFRQEVFFRSRKYFLIKYRNFRDFLILGRRMGKVSGGFFIILYSIIFVILGCNVGGFGYVQ